MNLVLIGYRGTGKSTIGRILSEDLGMPCVSLDAEIVRRAGMSIPEIVERHGWEHFRDRESDVTEELSSRDGLILDTGGGVVTRSSNVVKLRKSGPVFLLTATLDEIVRRIGGDDQRPSLTGTKSFTDEVAEVLAQRDPLYRGAADHVIDTTGEDPEETARRIAALFRGASA